MLTLDGETPQTAVPVQAVGPTDLAAAGVVAATVLSDKEGRFQFINLRPGRYQIRGAVRDGLAKQGSVWYDIDVPDFAVTLGVSSVVLTSRASAGPVTVDDLPVNVSSTALDLQAGVDLARQMGAALITFDGTQHTVVFNGDQCVDTAVVNYLVDSVAPPDGLRC